MRIFKLINIYIQVIFYIVAGFNHFRNPGVYETMMPSWVPFPMFMIYASGAAEILAGALFAIPRFRWWGALAIILVLIGVFPANVAMALNQGRGFVIQAEPWVYWVRLPAQFLLMAWAYWLRNVKEY